MGLFLRASSELMASIIFWTLYGLLLFSKWWNFDVTIVIGIKISLDPPEINLRWILDY